jgi:predicted translin family RNA/ssDNA-binding protein
MQAGISSPPKRRTLWTVSQCQQKAIEKEEDTLKAAEKAVEDTKENVKEVVAEKTNDAENAVKEAVEDALEAEGKEKK